MDRFEITCADADDMILGRAYAREGDRFAPRSVFACPRTAHWCTNRPLEILELLGLDGDARRAREFTDLLDGNLDGFAYLWAASQDGHGEEALKWIMGSLAALLNERGLPFTRASEILPPDYLNAFVAALAAGKFEKSFAKDVFAALVAAPRYGEIFGCEWVWEHPEILGGEAVFRGSRLSVKHVLGMIENGETVEAILKDYPYLSPDHIVMGAAYVEAREDMGWWTTDRFPGVFVMMTLATDPRFQAAGDDAIDAIIKEVVAANPDQAKKVTDNPKLVGWFIGQVVKAAKAKGLPPLPPPTVQGLLNGFFFEGNA